MSVRPASIAVQDLEFGVDELLVGKAKKFGELVHQVMFDLSIFPSTYTICHNRSISFSFLGML